MSNDDRGRRPRRHERRQPPPPRPDAPEVHPVEEEPPTAPQPRLSLRRIRRKGLPVEMAQEVGLIERRRGEWYVGAKWVPRWIISESCLIEEGGRKVVPWRLLTLRRHINWPKYDDIAASDRPLIVSQAALTAFAPPVIVAIIALVVSLIALVGGALSIALVAGLWFLLATPLWLLLAYWRWWFNVYAVREAELAWYAGWANPKSDAWSAESIFKEGVRYRGGADLSELKGLFKVIRWFVSLFTRTLWRIIRIGDVEIKDADGSVFGTVNNVPDPKTFSERIIRPMTTAAERAAERTARASEATAKSAARQANYARLGLIAQLRAAGTSDEAIADMIGEDVEAITAIPR